MVINENIVTGKKYRICTDSDNNTWDRISFWTDASDVEMDDGKTAEEAIEQINTDLAMTPIEKDEAILTTINEKLNYIVYNIDDSGGHNYYEKTLIGNYSGAQNIDVSEYILQGATIDDFEVIVTGVSPVGFEAHWSVNYQEGLKVTATSYFPYKTLNGNTLSITDSFIRLQFAWSWDNHEDAPISYSVYYVKKYF